MSTGAPIFSGPPTLPLERHLLVHFPADPATFLRCERQVGSAFLGQVKEGELQVAPWVGGSGAGEVSHSLQGAGTRLSLLAAAERRPM